MDHFGHKSNSTYFVDLDFARAHHVYSLFWECARSYESRFSNPEVPSGGRFNYALGGMTCVFKRSIGIFQKYEIWTRVCYWNEKWAYIISHFVQEGVVKPRTFSDMATEHSKASLPFPEDEMHVEKPRPTIYAVIVSKVVFKEGRKTIPPVEFLRTGNFLPEVADEETESNNLGERDEKPSRASTTRELWDSINRKKARGQSTMEAVMGLEDGVQLFDEDVEIAFRKY